MYCIRAFLPLLLMPFPSTAPYFVILYYISLYRHHRPCVYCVFTVILLFSTTCYWGADRCWLDLNRFNIFDPIRHIDGSPTSTFGLQLPTFMSTIDDYLESFLRLLGGGEPLARVMRASSDFSAATKTTGSASAALASRMSLSPTLDSVADAVAAVLWSAAGVGEAGTASAVP
ncbi:hypothetical protein EDD21DRAFT_186794 [Dissophora ornata]|nr:hypothetical protein EDD21DRAFT_186794 [Dissophora ornata]